MSPYLCALVINNSMSNEKKKVDRRVRILTEAEKKKIKRLYVDKQMGALAVRLAVGCGVDVLNRFLKEEGIYRTVEQRNDLKGNHRLRIFSKAERKDIVERYSVKGEKITNIAKTYGCCNIPILRVLLEEGFDVRGMKPNSKGLKKLYKKFEDQDNK